GASVMAMTYRGSQHVIPGYKIMGVAKAALEASVRYLADDLGPSDIRVNAISSGPIKTLAASGVGVRSMGKTIEEQAPLRRKVLQTDIGGAAVYLSSDLSRPVTGQVLYVDAGASVIAPF
ncbi:MAG: SDR family oxidoreductase, partial [Bacteriovoracaceae bacterium]|nr:SDR family oxidoreductase [Bacteriovoracaceae bacterium]